MTEFDTGDTVLLKLFRKKETIKTFVFTSVGGYRKISKRYVCVGQNRWVASLNLKMTRMILNEKKLKWVD